MLQTEKKPGLQSSPRCGWPAAVVTLHPRVLWPGLGTNHEDPRRLITRRRIAPSFDAPLQFISLLVLPPMAGHALVYPGPRRPIAGEVWARSFPRAGRQLGSANGDTSSSVEGLRAKLGDVDARTGIGCHPRRVAVGTQPAQSPGWGPRGPGGFKPRLIILTPVSQ